MGKWAEWKEVKSSTGGRSVEKHAGETGNCWGVAYDQPSLIFIRWEWACLDCERKNLETFENLDEKGNIKCCSKGPRRGEVSLNLEHKWRSEPWMWWKVDKQKSGWPSLPPLTPPCSEGFCSVILQSNPHTSALLACLYLRAFLPNKLWVPCNQQWCIPLVSPMRRTLPRIYDILNKHVLITECFQSWTEQSQPKKTAFQR